MAQSDLDRVSSRTRSRTSRGRLHRDRCAPRCLVFVAACCGLMIWSPDSMNLFHLLFLGFWPLVSGVRAVSIAAFWFGSPSRRPDVGGHDMVRDPVAGQGSLRPSLANVIQIRMLPDQEAKEYFRKAGPPPDRVVLARAAIWMGRQQRCMSDSRPAGRARLHSLPRLVLSDGLRTYLTYLAGHPYYLLRSLWHSPNRFAHAEMPDANIRTRPFFDPVPARPSVRLRPFGLGIWGYPSMRRPIRLAARLSARAARLVGRFVLPRGGRVQLPADLIRALPRHNGRNSRVGGFRHHFRLYHSEAWTRGATPFRW